MGKGIGDILKRESGLYPRNSKISKLNHTDDEQDYLNWELKTCGLLDENKRLKQLRKDIKKCESMLETIKEDAEVEDNKVLIHEERGKLVGAREMDEEELDSYKTWCRIVSNRIKEILDGLKSSEKYCTERTYSKPEKARRKNNLTKLSRLRDNEINALLALARQQESDPS